MRRWPRQCSVSQKLLGRTGTRLVLCWGIWTRGSRGGAAVGQVGARGQGKRPPSAAKGAGCVWPQAVGRRKPWPRRRAAETERRVELEPPVNTGTSGAEPSRERVGSWERRGGGHRRPRLPSWPRLGGRWKKLGVPDTLQGTESGGQPAAAEGPSPGPQPARGEAQVWRLWAGRGPPRAEALNAEQRQAAVPHGPWAGWGQSPWGARHIGGQNGTSANLREHGSGSLRRGLRTLLEHCWLGVESRRSKMPLQKPERLAPQKVAVFGNGLFTKAFRLQRGSRGDPRAIVPMPFEEAIRTQARTEGWPREGTGRGRTYTPRAEASRATGPVTADLTLPAPRTPRR